MERGKRKKVEVCNWKEGVKERRWRLASGRNQGRRGEGWHVEGDWEGKKKVGMRKERRMEGSKGARKETGC